MKPVHVCHFDITALLDNAHSRLEHVITPRFQMCHTFMTYFSVGKINIRCNYVLFYDLIGDDEQVEHKKMFKTYHKIFKRLMLTLGYCIKK